MHLVRHTIIATLLCSVCMAAAGAGENDVKLTIDIVGLHSHKGTVKLAVFAEADGFPHKSDKAVRTVSQPIDGAGPLRVEIMVPAGTHAVAAYHDENDDGVLNKNFFGVPLEGTGFSNGQVARFGAPSFARCAVLWQKEPMRIAMHY